MAMKPRKKNGVKKMRGGGMVKKMRGGGMVKKMRGGGMVKKDARWRHASRRSSKEEVRWHCQEAQTLS